jgi:hypothetical protein
MTFSSVSINPQTTPVITEILANLAFSDCKMFYSDEIDRTFRNYWGEEIDDEEYNWNGYIDATWDLVEEGKVGNDIKFWLLPEKKAYLEKNVLNAKLYMTRYSSSDEHELTVEYLLSAGEEDECLVVFVIKMYKLGVAEEVTMEYESDNANNKAITWLLLNNRNA